MSVLVVAAAMMLAQDVERSVQLAPGRIEEPCFSLAEYDRVDFSFRSDQVLDFNLHYHAETVVFPIQVAGIQSREGSYIAPIAQQYCLMWTNKQATPVQLEYQYRVYSSQEAQ